MCFELLPFSTELSADLRAEIRESLRNEMSYSLECNLLKRARAL